MMRAVPPLYTGLSFLLITRALQNLPVEPQRLLVAQPPPQVPTPEWVAVWAVLASVVLFVFDTTFRRERRRTFGMLSCAVLLLASAFFAAIYWNHRALLNTAWPALLGVAGAWTRDIDDAYAPERAWKWEGFFGAIYFLAILAFIPFALALGLPQFQQVGQFQFQLACVTTHGVGLLLCLFIYLGRFSPHRQGPGILAMLGLCFRVVAAAIRSGRNAADTSMTIASVSNSLSDLLSEMLAGSERTIMYTDIRASTEIVERLGAVDSYRLFIRSWALSCEVLKRRNATTPKDMGDGLIATFATSRDALLGAIEILKLHADHNAKVGAAERLDLKVGLHRGHVLLHYGWDPRGPDSHLAQRVVGQAEPGTIMMTRSTYDDIRLGGWQIVGEHRPAIALKGFSAPVDLVQIVPGPVLTSPSITL